MDDPAVVVSSSMLGGLQEIRLPRCRHERSEREHWEATRLCSMRALLNPGDVIYDVGSEMGDLSALYALWGCGVVLCEPNPASWPWARLTFEANDLRPKACWHGFVSDHTRWDGPPGGMIWESPDWPVCSTGPLDPATGFVTEHERGAEWPSTTIDDLVRLVIAPPDAITVDVEGYELRVMRGAAETLRDHRPVIWLSEHDSFMWDIGDDPDDLESFMDDYDYEPRFLTVDHERHRAWLPAERAVDLWPQ